MPIRPPMLTIMSPIRGSTLKSSPVFETVDASPFLESSDVLSGLEGFVSSGLETVDDDPSFFLYCAVKVTSPVIFIPAMSSLL